MEILHYLCGVLFCVCLMIDDANALRFFVRPGANNKKCLKEEIHKDVLVSGDYEFQEMPGQKGSIHITDSKSHTLFKKEDASKGKFAFTTEEYDMFQVCFETKMIAGGQGADREVFIDMKHGVEAKDYGNLAKAEKLKPLEVELRRLEDLSESIVNDFAYMRAREEEMRDTNESTHSRVLYFSVFSMCCLLGLATWQVLYLRRFFKAKKLIE
ncbi:transmembrane emp24 domain-containing protein 10-like [Tubulanus polymorphus]|uniref:transmembrane emp24 domain-containing protein 10-like n=1 Tax=Tubulanus polymorphus TaxID=672921 RepID=UPI003DA1E2FD